jgi:hypothetical protein
VSAPPPRREPPPGPEAEAGPAPTTRDGALRRVEQEILAEKAATLGRAGARLEAALARAAALREAFAAAPHAARPGLAREYEAARRAAREARRALLIQREAIGLRSHRLVDQRYPEPPPLPAAP